MNFGQRRGAYWKRALIKGGCLLFFYFGSAVGEALKVVNKVALETGFPCVPAIKERDEGGTLIQKRCLFYITALWVGTHLGEGHLLE